MQISLHIEVKQKKSGISNKTHHRQKPKDQNEMLISKGKSVTEMKVKHKRRHDK